MHADMTSVAAETAEIELHHQDGASTQLLPTSKDTTTTASDQIELPHLAEAENDLPEDEDSHLHSVSQTISRHLPEGRWRRYALFVPIWLYFHILDLLYKSWDLERFASRKGDVKEPNRLDQIMVKLGQAWARLPPKLAWRKMLLLWTFLTWGVCAGFCTYIVTRRSGITSIEEVRPLPCGKRRLWQVLVLSLPLNILGSLLVSASSFTRQILMSPTRTQLDQAHRQQKSLTIASPSLRNLRSMSVTKAVVWVSLTLTSFPFHFLLNALFYATVKGHDAYQIVVSDSAYNNGVPPLLNTEDLKPYNKTKTALDYANAWPNIDGVEALLTDVQLNTDLLAWQNLTWLQCFDKITKTSIYTEQRHVIMFSSYQAPTNLTSVVGSALLSGVNYGTQRPVAICPPKYLQDTPGFSEPNANGIVPKTSKIKKSGKKVGNAMCWPYWNGTSTKLRKDNLNSDRFTGYDPSADLQLNYCLSEVVEPVCALYYSPLIAVIAAAVTGAQALLMTVSLLITQETPLVLLGDVIDAYLKRSDIHTAPKENLTDTEVRSLEASQGEDYLGFWAVITVFLVIQLIVLISWGSTTMDNPGLFGTEDNPRRWFIGPVCISGAVQLVLVLREYSENVIATMIRADDEFNQYAYRRTALRVSSPRPSLVNKQKGGYVLQLPIGAAVWHIATSAFIHWWVSLYFSLQLLMVVRMDNGPDYPELNARPNKVLVACFSEVFRWFIKIFKGSFSGVRGGSGSEFLAILFLIIVVPFTVALVVIFAGPLLIHGVAILLLGVNRSSAQKAFRIGNGLDSLVISTACHPPADEGDISEKNIKWGYTSRPGADGRHILTFSSCAVERYVANMRAGPGSPIGDSGRLLVEVDDNRDTVDDELV